MFGLVMLRGMNKQTTKNETPKKNVPVKTAIKAGMPADQVVFVQPPPFLY